MADATPDPADVAVRACPDCMSSQIYARLRTSPKYRCSRCGHEFDTPVRRRTGDGPMSQG